jgi:gas vesicle protein
MRHNDHPGRRTAVTGVLLVLAGSAAGCGTTPSASASTSASTSAMCDSVASLQQSVNHLRDMQLSENGVAAMRDQLRQVQTDLDDVVAQTQSGYQDLVATLKADAATIRSAAQAVKAHPTADTLAAVKPPLQTLTTDVQRLADQVSPRCS